MTELLQQAIAALEKLSDEQQDAIATRLLDELEIEHSSAMVSHSPAQNLGSAELEDERVWQAQFEATTDTQWDCMAAMVRQEIAAGDVVPLDLVF